MLTGQLKTGKLNIDNSALVKRCLTGLDDKTVATLNFNSKIFERVIVSHGDAKVNQDGNPHTWPEFAPVLDGLAHLFTSDQITMSWVNITLPGGIMHSHRHQHAADKVFVYYININQSHPSIEFLNNGQWCKCNCVTGTWFLFPHDLYHRTGINTGTGDRISMAANISNLNS